MQGTTSVHNNLASICDGNDMMLIIAIKIIIIIIVIIIMMMMTISIQKNVGNKAGLK